MEHYIVVGLDNGVYLLVTQDAFPTREEAEQYAATVDASRRPLVITGRFFLGLHFLAPAGVRRQVQLDEEAGNMPASRESVLTYLTNPREQRMRPARRRSSRPSAAHGKVCARWLVAGWRDRRLLSRPRVALECDIRAKSGRGEAIEPFEITDEMAVIAHTDVVDDFLHRKVRLLRELFGFFHPELFQVSGWRLTGLGPEKAAKVRWRQIHGSSQFLENQRPRELIVYERRYQLNAAVHMSRLCGSDEPADRETLSATAIAKLCTPGYQMERHGCLSGR